MQVRLERENGTVTLHLAGRFDFNTLQAFREAFTDLPADENCQIVQINLYDVDYLDSSALSILLMGREKMQSAGKEIVLSGVRGSVRQVLDIANFNRLFRTV